MDRIFRAKLRVPTSYKARGIHGTTLLYRYPEQCEALLVPNRSAGGDHPMVISRCCSADDDQLLMISGCCPDDDDQLLMTSGC